MKQKIGVGVVVAVIVAVAVVGSRVNANSAAGKSQNAVVHLSNMTNDLHSAFMAVKLGSAMQAGPAQVTLFLDLEGVRLVDNRQPLDLRWGPGHKGLNEYYEGFVASGGKVLVCPHCAAAAGIESDSLREGAQIASENQLAEMLAAADKILDY